MQEKENLTTAAYRIIKRKIYNFDYLPGQAISDYLISKDMKMSRTPIRQALERLKAEGLIEAAGDRKNGYRITAITEEEIKDIFDFRLSLELTALRLAAENQYIDEKALKGLREILNEMISMRAKGKIEEHFSADQRFHNALVELSGNKRLIHAHEMLLTQLQRIRFLSFINQSLQKKASNDHQGFLEALLQSDYEGAEALLKQHIESSKRDYISILSNKELSIRSIRVLRYFLETGDKA